MKKSKFIVLSDDDAIYAITFKSNYDSVVFNRGSNYYNYIYFDLDTSGSRYVDYYRYNNEYVYDIKQYDHNNYGIYSNIYGKIYIEDLLDVMKMYFGRMRA